MDERQSLREERKVQLNQERFNSLPYGQLQQQQRTERERIIRADRIGRHTIPDGSDPSDMAHNTVKSRWIEQGIWNNNWNEMASGIWKRQEPLNLDPEQVKDAESTKAPRRSLFFSHPSPQPETQQNLITDENEKRHRERHDILQKEREASRPYYQFVYQISKEREYIKDISSFAEDSLTYDLNTQAYTNVKHLWEGRGIWNEEWGTLPGMWWKHEEPLDLEDLDIPTPMLREKVKNALHYTDPMTTEQPAAPAQLPPATESSYNLPRHDSTVPDINAGELGEGQEYKQGSLQETEAPTAAPRRRGRPRKNVASANSAARALKDETGKKLRPRGRPRQRPLPGSDSSPKTGRTQIEDGNDGTRRRRKRIKDQQSPIAPAEVALEAPEAATKRKLQGEGKKGGNRKVSPASTAKPKGIPQQQPGPGNDGRRTP